MNTIRRLAVTLLCVSMAGACDNDATAPEPNPHSIGTDVELTSAPESVFVGRSALLRLRDTTDDNPNPANYIWSTSDPSIATVDSTGRLVAVGIGSVRITAFRAGAFDTLRLRVVPMVAPSPVALAVGGQGSGGSVSADCAIGVDGAVYCRKAAVAPDSIPIFERKPGAAGMRFTSVSTSLHAQCALNEEGAIYCWGNNAHFLFATRTAVRTDTGPVPVRTPLRFLQMQHAGHSQTCGVSKADSLAYCWGHNDFYQLANGGRNDDSLPRPVVGMGKARYVSTENFHTCALDIDGKAYCSGQSGFYGGSGFEGLAREMSVVLGDQRYTSISTGDTFQCSIAIDRSAWCAGSNNLGTLGIGTNIMQLDPAPAKVMGNLQFRVIRAIYRVRTCGITVDDDLYCWGGSDPSQWRPVHRYPGIKFLDIIGSSCYLTKEGAAIC